MFFLFLLVIFQMMLLIDFFYLINIPYPNINFTIIIIFQRFPWGNGDQTLFHNPKLNATSHGYEQDE